MRIRLPLRLAYAWLLACVLLFVSVAFPATKKPPPHPIDINSANSAQLQQVPGIGPATADKILQTRKSYGAFKNVDDLLSVRGIGPKKLAKMRKYLVAGRAVPARKAGGPGTTATSAARSAGCAKCARGVPPVPNASNAKKTAIAAPKPTPASGSAAGEAPESDEEPE